MSVAACGGDRSTTVSPAATEGVFATALPTAVPTSGATPTPAPEATPTPPPSADTTPEAVPTPAPTVAGDPRLLYAEFLLRLADARPQAADLSEALLSAAERQDPAAVRRAAVDVLDFTDEERTWLRSHPPADCYADSHASAERMVAAYAATAEDAIDWADAGGGLAGLEALASVAESAADAREALADLAADLETTRCGT